MGVESLEHRVALTAVPTIGLTAKSDTGIKGDGITNLTRPVFAGAAPAKSTVFVYADEHLLGSVKATSSGAWSLAKPLTAGPHVISAYAVGPDASPSATTTTRVTVDPVRPTASISFDPNYAATPGGRVTGRVTLTFSEPVQGVRLGNFRFTDPASRFTTRLDSPLLKGFLGTITTTQLSDRSYAFTPSSSPYAAGSYSLTFLKTGVKDLAGNPMAADASLRVFLR